MFFGLFVCLFVCLFVFCKVPMVCVWNWISSRSINNDFLSKRVTSSLVNKPFMLVEQVKFS